MLISGFCIYYIKAQNYGIFLLKTSHLHLNHAISMFSDANPNSVTLKSEKNSISMANFMSSVYEVKPLHNWTKYSYKKHIFTPLFYSWGTKNSHFLLKSRFFQIAKRAKMAYFDVDLLHRKTVGAKTLLKSRFLLILTLLKPRFHCILDLPQGRKDNKMMPCPITIFISN